jgi:hypothetical protein
MIYLRISNGTAAGIVWFGQEEEYARKYVKTLNNGIRMYI